MEYNNRKIDDNKFTAMMRECEREALTHAASLHPSSEPSKRFANAAADWRAMREAWEAMVESLDEVMQFIPYEKPELGPLPNWICKIKARAEAALAKARGE